MVSMSIKDLIDAKLKPQVFAQRIHKMRLNIIRESKSEVLMKLEIGYINKRRCICIIQTKINT